MEYLRTHSLIHTSHTISNYISDDSLSVVFEWEGVLCSYLFEKLMIAKSLYLYAIKRISREMFVFHDFLCDTDKSCEFLGEKSEWLCIELHDTILDSLEIDLDGCYRCADLMREIREKVWSDLFLDSERLGEIVYSRNEWEKFIISLVCYTCTLFFEEKVIERMYDCIYRAKYSTRPEKVPKCDTEKPENIGYTYPGQEGEDEVSFCCISRESSRIHQDIYYIATFCNIGCKYIFVDIPRTWYIEFWVFWDVFEDGWYIGKLGYHSTVFFLIFFIKFSYLYEGIELLRIGWEGFFFLVFEILRKKCLKCHFKSDDIYKDREDEYDTRNERNLIGKTHKYFLGYMCGV